MSSSPLAFRAAPHASVVRSQEPIKRNLFHACSRDARGHATVEYVVLLVCVAVAFTAAWGTFGRQIVSIIAGE